jgi:hypothetical protein
MTQGKDGKCGSAARLEPRISSLRELSATYDGRNEDVALRPPDVSTRGIFIDTTRNFPEGAVLKVRFRLGLSREEIRCRARFGTACRESE